MILRIIPIFTLFLFSCRSEYAALRPATGAEPACVLKFKPAFSARQYRASIDVTGRHLSGILVFKKMPGGNTRVVFTGETGPTFFDFEIGRDEFKVHFCLRRLKRKAVINTLRRDFEVLLMENTGRPVKSWQKEDDIVYHEFTHNNSKLYYITDQECRRLPRAELAGKRKPKVRFTFTGYEEGMPASVVIEHQTFTFVVHLNTMHSLNSNQD